MAMVKIKLFAWFREKAKASEVDFSLENEATVAEVLELLREKVPELEEVLKEKNYFVAVNHELAENSTKVKDSDEVAIFPPVSGG